jgi:hypothetical protein
MELDLIQRLNTQHWKIDPLKSPQIVQHQRMILIIITTITITSTINWLNTKIQIEAAHPPPDVNPAPLIDLGLKQRIPS